MAQRVPITVRLDHFEGPLDLLLYLIQSHELDISTVSIGRITDQYLAYVMLLQELNFDIASEFLVMAATLVHWKSRALLPKEADPLADGEDDGPLLTEEDLVRQILEHQRFLEAGDDLNQFPRLHQDVFCRANKRPPIERVWREMNITDLSLSYQDCLVRERKRKRVLRKETVSLSEKIRQFDNLEIGRMTGLKDLMAQDPSVGEKVVTFLASLELSKIKRLRVFQQEVYAPIFVELLERLAGVGSLEITSAMEKEFSTQETPAEA